MIVWSDKSIETINNIMQYLNTTKMIQPLGYMVEKYLARHLEKVEYQIHTANNITVQRDSIILAYTCETYIKVHQLDNVITNKKLYKIFGKVIYEIINEFFSYIDWELNFEENHLINLLTEIFPTHLDNNIDIREIVRSGYFFVKHLIITIEQNPNLSYFMDSLLVKCQDLNLDFLTNKQKREILSILRTRRTLYLRFLLIIINDMIHEKSTINILWIKRKMRIKNIQMLRDVMENVTIQMIITITGNNCFAHDASVKQK